MEATDSGTTRRASWALLVGAVLLVVGNSLHPVDVDPSPLSRLELAGSSSWLLVHVVIASGVLVTAFGLLAVATDGDGRSSGARTALASSAIVGGGVLAAVFAGLDGFGSARLAAAASDGVPGEVVHGAAIALEAVDTGLAGIGTVLFMGVGMVALAAVVRRGGPNRRRLPVFAGLVGLAGTVAGLALLSAGPTPTTINVLLRPAALGTTVVVLWLGLALRRPAVAEA